MIVWSLLHSTYCALACTRWLGASWDTECNIGPTVSTVWTPFRPNLCFDDHDRGWLVWAKQGAGDSNFISSCCWDDSWRPEVSVVHDSFIGNYAPYVACGGGKVWCV
jgi:hypothetical protein